VKPYNELTRQGKLRRLRRLVFKALEQYDLHVKWVRFLTIAANTMFQIQAKDGARYVLRIYSPERVTLLNDVSERAEEVFEQLYADADGQILIHGDLHYWNVHLDQGELYVIDF
jgi:Ser/Thr protein kinase RdoA (MazF antagonist)